MMNERQWRTYHEFVCSEGLPWDCEKRCILWRHFDQQRRYSEGKPVPTYHDLRRV
jgi:hypothetical protein